MLPGL